MVSDKKKKGKKSAAAPPPPPPPPVPAPHAGGGRSGPAFRIVESEFGYLVPIHVQPNASRAGIVGLFGDVLKVAVTKPPDQGQANEALIETLAEIFGLKRSQVTIRAGWTTRDKTICLVGMRKDEIVAIANRHLPKGAAAAPPPESEAPKPNASRSHGRE